ncbi:hypothetical protein Bca52824_044227 [Brassica carinata]|uniref:non-specific serine/threonine protein kinase n=1 Tax=Brassica carinata TaxID=52824 RepID=A0A8X7S1L2_BRACI|nr:hypothetical protein Bca52824_044227 [Brassica carinata]
MFLKLLTIVFFFSILSQSLQPSSQNLEFTFNGFYPPLSDISVQGISSVTPKGVLKLTNFTTTDSGHAFYSKQIRFRDSPNETVSSFSTTFVFVIRPVVPGIGAEGMAFVIAPNFSLPTAAPSEDLGLFNIINNGNDLHHVFAVEFDTVQDPLDDPDNNHVGIDINSLKSVKTSPAGYWYDNDQFKKLTLVSGKPMQVWVDYDGRTHWINVTMAPFRKEKPKKALVSIVRDLSSVLLQDMFVGFLSATGTILSEHFVLGWSFRVKGKAPLLTLSELPMVKQRSWMTWFALMFVFLLLFTMHLLRRRKFAEEIEDWETEFAKNRMKFKDLYYATKGFKDNGLLGRGGFGSVYKGVMPKTKKEIAVKRVSNKSQQGLKEFVAEIASIGRMSHRNLVPLLGYCRRKDELLLVYDYMPNGSLDKYLHNSPEVALDWNQRIKIIKGVASALFFLHEDWEQVVIHRDVKSSNVLLDAEHNGRLGDFGLARLCGHGTDPETTNVAGTWGYLAPDHIMAFLEGGFGSVYKGVMPKTKKEIAVKRVSNKSQQGLKEFVSEIASIGRMSHRNLVPLLGYCRRKDELLLVYDYMPNGSLDKYLHNSPEVALNWNQRIKIIKGVASALFFLHEDWEQVVIHRDVKSSNVLLDAEHNGRLGDFGLARLCGHGTEPETTNVAGTWGYLAPDHLRTGRATTATDVFAFGVLLLEVVCGRRPIEFQNRESGERVFLVDWVFHFWEDGNILDAKDPNLWHDYEVGEIEMVLKLGLLCSQSDPENRPTMRQVLHYLRGDVLLPNLSPSDLRGSERLLGIPEVGFSESSLSTGGSSVTNSLLSVGR